ncbi:hypothetical protein JAAARDRAFT_345578 [Jaapia argillacea MUCL 33604]|uniref:Uncharacterized protein n=1 Tax=Jaapia argillacea MUCL 33604 TaxID=933084 RepID=A0A067PY20_9AGAM|nr:hypothetical protein JAAARDRAFT_345578 [Jaapia argillacea MUCL 33604]
MNAAALRKLPRFQLQTLAKANEIKGNLKSEAIIKNLLELHPNGVPPASRRSLSVAPTKPSHPSPTKSASPRKPSPVHSTTTTPTKSPPPRKLSVLQRLLSPRRSSARHSPPRSAGKTPARTSGNLADTEGAAPRSPREPLIPRPDSPASTVSAAHTDSEHDFRSLRTYYSTPEVEASPIPEPAAQRIQNAVDILANIAKEDDALGERANALRVFADRLVERAMETRTRVILERRRRERAQVYMTYYEDVPHEWQQDEIYDFGEKSFRTGEVQPGVFRELESDEESDEPRRRDSNMIATVLNGQQPPEVETRPRGDCT